MKKITTLILLTTIILSLTSCNIMGEVEQINDSLTIYVDPRQKRDLSEAIYEYRLANSDIEINIVEIGGEEDYTKMRTELMGRNGPDVILVDGYTFPDARKTMATGVFADLTPFLKADTSYNEDDYYSQIMKVGEYKGLQCVFPISFTFPSVITTQEGLKEYGLEFSDKADLLEVTEQAVKFINQNNSTELLPYQPNLFGKTEFNYFNIISDIIDYETHTIDLNSEQFLQATHNYKEFYKAADLKHTMTNRNYSHSSDDMSKNLNNLFLFFNTNMYSNVLSINFNILSELIEMDQTPVVMPIYGFEGEINAKMKYGLAINNYSENKQNAYDFLKIAVDLPHYRLGYLGKWYGIKKSELQNVLNESNERLDFGIYDGVQLGNDVVEQQQAFINDIGSCSMPSGVTDMLYEYFVPYFEDEQTLEECVEVAQRKMEIYMSE